jgi:hypothetical protein
VNLSKEESPEPIAINQKTSEDFSSIIDQNGFENLAYELDFAAMLWRNR